MRDQLWNKRTRFVLGYIILGMLLFILVQWMQGGWLAESSSQITYSKFKIALRAGNVESVTIGDEQLSGRLVDGQLFTAIPIEDPDLLAELEQQGVEVSGQRSNDGGLVISILSLVLPLALMVGFWYVMMKRMNTGGGASSSLFSFGKSKARLIYGEQTRVTFTDVGGADEAVLELREVTAFLRDPHHFQRLGGKMPKGVLLVGPPGTGKTLLARATAGAADVPFFSMSAAEFVEMFVGVGAARVRDLFDKAKRAAPSIIFIDEIDAIGGRRVGAGSMGNSYQEREQTLNQLLAEMDGFEASRGVIVMAATNRPEILDPALLRPGRFDRQIIVDLPDLVGRNRILGIHTAQVALADDIELSTIARITAGFSGADLANVINEAALLAARQGKDAVEMSDFDAAIERVMAGSERRTRAISEREKKIIAYHEAGHAIVASLLPATDPVHKVTIVPRGRALGYTMQLPAEDRYLMSEDELRDRLAVLLGGRVAEALTFGKVSTGAVDDLTQATDLARRMVTEYGMSPALGPVRLAADPQMAYLDGQAGLDPRISPATAGQVDVETRRIVEEALARAWTLLEEQEEVLRRLAGQLCRQETVTGSDVLALLEQPASVGLEAPLAI